MGDVFSQIMVSCMDYVAEISFSKTPVVDEKNVDFSNMQGLEVI